MTVRNPLIWHQGYLSELPNGDVVQFSVGTTANPGITFRGNSGYGLSLVSSRVCVSVAGVLVGALGATGYSQSIAGGGSSLVAVAGEGTTNVSASRYSANTSGPSVTLQKGRGTIASPAVPVLGDTLGETDVNGVNGAGFTPASSTRTVLTETGTVGTNMGSQYQILVTPIGSGTLTEVARFDIASGFSMFGANPVIDQNRLVRLRNFTVAALPASPPDGATAFATDSTQTLTAGIGTAVVGGSTNKVPVVGIGGVWTIG